MKTVNREIGDAIETFESHSYVVPTYDVASGHTKYDTPHAPRFHSVRRLKERHADYRAGPVKVYTAQEIEDYVRSQALSKGD